MTDITVGQLIDLLKEYPRDKPINFGANVFAVPLRFNRVKDRGTQLQIDLYEDFTVHGTYTVDFDGALAIDGPNLDFSK